DFEDSITFHPILGSAQGSEQRAAVLRALERADGAVLALRNLGGDLALAAGGERAVAAANAAATGYRLIEPDFLDWLRTITPDADLPAAEDRWVTSCRARITAAGDELVDTAAPAAWV